MKGGPKIDYVNRWTYVDYSTLFKWLHLKLFRGYSAAMAVLRACGAIAVSELFGLFCSGACGAALVCSL